MGWEKDVVFSKLILYNAVLNICNQINTLNTSRHFTLYHYLQNVCFQANVKPFQKPFHRNIGDHLILVGTLYTGMYGNLHPGH